MHKHKSNILSCLDEIEDFLCTLDRDKKDCPRHGRPECHFDFGWRLSAAWENLKIRICGRRRR